MMLVYRPILHTLWCSFKPKKTKLTVVNSSNVKLNKTKFKNIQPKNLMLRVTSVDTKGKKQIKKLYTISNTGNPKNVNSKLKFFLTFSVSCRFAFFDP